MHYSDRPSRCAEPASAAARPVSARPIAAWRAAVSLALLVALSLPVGCAPTPAPDDTSDSGTDITSATSRAEVLERDVDGDGINEVLIVAVNEGGGLDATADRDGDGRVDLWATIYGGALEDVAVDSNGDGEANLWELFDDANRLSERREDTNGDGTADVWTEFGPSGKVTSARQDSNGDGQPDIWSAFDDAGRLREIAYDRDHDGEEDYWVVYAPDGSIESFRSR